ncbi:hypothetical protein RRG08_055793 [Elysia crispata]|uniref:Uncharacterized protein n=1 Tax=Elysia crispata TaxID=231223 RepID=A0AAE0XSH0_9GAST|nr:hypothetical protein RRG08_055793 [Elysia crispata]
MVTGGTWKYISLTHDRPTPQSWLDASNSQGDTMFQMKDCKRWHIGVYQSHTNRPTPQSWLGASNSQDDTVFQMKD